MAQERDTAFSLYLSDMMDIIRKPGMSADEVVSYAEKEWDNISKEIKMFYIEREVNIFVANRNKDNDMNNDMNNNISNMFYRNRVSFLNFHN